MVSVSSSWFKISLLSLIIFEIHIIPSSMYEVPIPFNNLARAYKVEGQ